MMQMYTIVTCKLGVGILTVVSTVNIITVSAVLVLMIVRILINVKACLVTLTHLALVSLVPIIAPVKAVSLVPAGNTRILTSVIPALVHMTVILPLGNRTDLTPQWTGFCMSPGSS